MMWNAAYLKAQTSMQTDEDNRKHTKIHEQEQESVKEIIKTMAEKGKKQRRKFPPLPNETTDFTTEKWQHCMPATFKLYFDRVNQRTQTCAPDGSSVSRSWQLYGPRKATLLVAHAAWQKSID
eukprot:598201-Lingulodinium_polyedra.AAC.1